ncbi:hypothetical protein GIX45_07560, partial [Erwinia sp. CPCC 100877]|nr:hypothetical protein [Erwinia sp. CPCC 100877]
SWSFTPEAPLDDGEHRLGAVESDAAGNVSAPAAAFPVVVDTTVPDAPEITSVYDDIDLHVGNIVTHGITNDAKPAISGTAGANCLVNIYIDDVIAGSVVADAAGKWSFTPVTELTDGEHGISATAMNAVGSVSERATEWNIEVDTIAPDTPILTEVTAGGTAVDGGGLTNDNRPIFSGTAEANSIVTVTLTCYEYIDDELTDVVLAVVHGSVTADASGNWSFQTPEALPDGFVDLELTATDEAGNISALPVETFDSTVDDSVAQALEGTSGYSQFVATEDGTSMPHVAYDAVLAISNDNEALALSGIKSSQAVHVVDLSAHGDNSLNISAEDILVHGDKDLFMDDGNNQMMVKGDEGDVVNLDNLLGDNSQSQWSMQETTDINGEQYQVWHDANKEVELFIQQGVNVDLENN